MRKDFRKMGKNFIQGSPACEAPVCFSAVRKDSGPDGHPEGLPLVLQSPRGTRGSTGQVENFQKRGSRNSGNCSLLLGLEMGRFGMKMVSMIVNTDYRKSGREESQDSKYSCHFLEETNSEADLAVMVASKCCYEFSTDLSANKKLNKIMCPLKNKEL